MVIFRFKYRRFISVHEVNYIYCNATSCTLLQDSAQVYLRSHTLKMILPTPEIYGESATRSEIQKLIIKLKN